MPSIPWESSSSPTAAEQRLDESLGQGRGRSKIDQPLARLNVHGTSHSREQEIRGEYLTRRLVEPPDEAGWRLFWRRSAQPPVVRVHDAVITGNLNLRAADLPYLLEFVRCRFEQPPDLRQANVAGLVFRHCRFPGLRARNLRTANDTMLLSCTSDAGLVNLTDANIGGSLEMLDTRLERAGRRAMHADRLVVSGALLAMRLYAAGEVRIPGAKIAGNLNFCGATLRNRGRHALNATGIQVGGSIRASTDPDTGAPFSAAGRIWLPSLHLEGDLRLRDAILEPGTNRTHRGESSQDDPLSTLVADRGEIRGDVQLDENFRSGGTVRMVSTKVGGNLRFSGAHVDLGWARNRSESVQRPLRTIHLDGSEIMGNLDASNVVLRGQFRMVDLNVHGGVQLNRAVLDGPRTDVFQANRMIVGSNLECRESDVSGTLHLQGARIGANVDLRATFLGKPAWHRHRETYKSSLDLRAASIGRDLVCAEGIRPFRTDGEVQLRRAVIERQTNFYGCLLGEGSAPNAINGFGLVTQELTLLPSGPPVGRVVLRQAQCELVADNANLWAATRGVDVEDFAYDNLATPVEATDHERVRERLRWLHLTSKGSYQPGPYDQLAAVFRDNGNEEHAVTVLIEKQRRRYQAIAQSSRAILRPAVWLWSLLQRATVSYGYRPMRALVWLVLFAALGTTWFALQPPLEPVNAEDNPVWSPLLYTVDQLVPIINLGHDVMWRVTGYSQWITVGLIAAGWILATTVAAGISRSLRREH